MLSRARDLNHLDLNITPLPGQGPPQADHALASAIAVPEDAESNVAGECQTSSTSAVGGGPLFTASHDRFQDIGPLVLCAAARIPIESHRPAKTGREALIQPPCQRRPPTRYLLSATLAGPASPLYNYGAVHRAFRRRREPRIRT